MNLEITEFDAADYIDGPAAMLVFLQESLVEPTGNRLVSSSIDAVARAAGGVRSLADLTGVDAQVIDGAIMSTDYQQTLKAVHALIDSLQAHGESSRLVA